MKATTLKTAHEYALETRTNAWNILRCSRDDLNARINEMRNVDANGGLAKVQKMERQREALDLAYAFLIDNGAQFLAELREKMEAGIEGWPSLMYQYEEIKA